MIPTIVARAAGGGGGPSRVPAGDPRGGQFAPKGGGATARSSLLTPSRPKAIVLPGKTPAKKRDWLERLFGRK